MAEGLGTLEPTEVIEPRYVDGKPRWSNQGDTGYDKFGGGQGKRAICHIFWNRSSNGRCSGDKMKSLYLY